MDSNQRVGAGDWFASRAQPSDAAQLRRLFRQGQRALKEKDFAKAADLFRQYLAFEPDDTEAIAQYAVALEQTSSAAQSRFKIFFLLEQVLRRQPDRSDVRLQAVQVAIDLGRMADAIDHLKYLLGASPPTSELEHRLGWCQEAEGRYEDSAASFRRAIVLDPAHIDSHILLAELLSRHLKQSEEAAKVMDEMVAANPKSWEAFLARARFHYGHGQLDAAALDVFAASALRRSKRTWCSPPPRLPCVRATSPTPASTSAAL